MQQTINKKFNILQELEQAIKRKAIDKQRSREHTNKQLLLSIDKRRAQSKSVHNKERGSDVKEKRTPSKEQTYVMKPFLMNNENLRLAETIEKKSIGKRVDKLLSLMNYTVSSAQKAIKFVNTANFEAQFAVKLFKSDRDALQMEIQLFIKTQEQYSRQSPLDSVKATTGNLTNLQNHSLKNENSTLRKQNLIAEAQISKLKEQKTLLATQLKNLKSLLSVQDKKQRLRIKDKQKQIDHLLKQIHDIDELKRVDKGKQSTLKHNLFLKQKEQQKLKSLMRDCYPLDSLEKYFDLLQKQTKFHMMLYSNYDNPKKKSELQLIIKSLQVQRQACQKKLQPIDYKQNVRNTQLKNYIRQRILPMLQDRQAEEMSEIEMIECWMRERNKKGHKVSQRQIQLENQLATLNNQIEILKIQNSKDKSEQCKRLTKDKQLLQANLQQIYDDLRGICLSNNLVENENEDQIDFEKIITSIKQFVEDAKARLKHVVQDHQKTILAIELAAERKSNKDKSKFIQQLQAENDKLLGRSVQLQDDMGKLTKKIDKMEKQIQEHDKMVEKSRKQGITIAASSQRISELECELGKSEQQKTGYLESLNDFKRQVQNLQSQIDKKDRSIKSFQDAVQQMKKSQDFLKLQLEKAKNQKTATQQSLTVQLQQYRVRIGQLQAQMSKECAKNEIKQLEEQLLRLGKIIKTQQSNILQLEQDKTRLSEQLTIEAEESQLRIQKLKQSEQRRMRLERDLKDALTKKDDSVDSDNEYAGKLQKQLAYSQKQLTEQRQKFKKLTAQWNSLKISSQEKEKLMMEEMKDMRRDSQLSAEELKNAKMEIDMLRTQNAQHVKQIEQLSHQLQQLSELNEELRMNMKQLQLKMSEFDDANSAKQRMQLDNVSELQHKYHQSQQILANTQAQLSQTRLRLNQTQKALDQLLQQLEQSRQRIIASEQKYKQREDRLKQTEERLEETHNTLQQTDQTLNNTQQTLKHAQDKLQIAEQNLKKYQSQLEAMKQQHFLTIQQLNSQIAKQSQQQLSSVKELKQQIDTLQQQINNKQHQIENMSCQLAAKQTEIQEICEQKNNHVQMLRNYMEQAKQQNQIRQMKNKQYAALVKTIIKKVVQLDGLEDQHDLDRLLELGTKKVFEWHKGREWQSSQKAVKEQTVVDRVEPFKEQTPNKEILDQIPVKIPKMEEVVHADQAIDDVDDFQDFQQKSMNASMMSVEPEPRMQQVMKQSQAIDLQELEDYGSNSGQKEEPASEKQQSEHKQQQPQNQQVLAEDQFQDFKEDSLNSSMMSNKGLIEALKAIQPPVQAVKTEQKQQRVKTDPMAADFDQFGSFHEESLSKSGIAQNQFDDFPDQLERALDSSMMSNDPRQPIAQNLHNILEGQNIGALEQEEKHSSFKDFLDNELKE